ncbi:glycosyltransferase family 2 protein [Candidatus Saccharibacteria bacterium]|nr:glycosyltransferase family 2 protein [Candidatus Saccharibacteria bacterium]
MNRVAIVVLNWNGIEDTLLCLESLLSQSYKQFHIVVIDNGSVDNSKELLKTYRTRHSDKIEVIYNPINFGFAGGVNTGIEWALNENFEYVALFNNDAVADKDWLKSLVDAAQPKEVGISTGLLLHENGKTIDSSGDWLSSWGLAFPRNRGDKTAKAFKAGLVFGATGGASLYKTALFKDIGLFDEDFFAYYEDADISFRAQLAGWKVAYTPKAIAYHKQGATSKKIPGFTTYHTFKNLPLLFLKNIPHGLLFPVGIRFYFAYWLILLNAIVKGNGIPAIKGAWMSFVLGFKKLGERRLIQKNKRVATSYVKSILWNDLPPDQTGVRKLRKFFTGK